MEGMVWAIALMIVGLVVMILEVFVPSGGVLGFVSIVAVIAAITTAFTQTGVLAGMALLASAVVLVPSVLLAAFRLFPVTPLGRRILPDPPTPEDVLPDRRRRETLRSLVGRRGVVVSELVPWGQVAVGEARIDAFSVEGPIGEGQVVTILGIEGLGAAVRRSDDSPNTASGNADGKWPEDVSARATDAGKESRPVGGDSRLSRTLEEFDFRDLTPPSDG